MLGVQILAWSFVIFLVLGRVAEFGNKQVNGHALSKLVDNITIICMLILLLFLYR